MMRLSIASFAGMVAVRGQDFNCTEADFVTISTMDAVAMGDCVNGEDNNIETCFNDKSIMNVTDACSLSLLVNGDGFVVPCLIDWCGEEYNDTSVNCQNCQEFAFMMLTAAVAPSEAHGACAADQPTLTTANVTLGIECGGDIRKSGAHCLATADGVSVGCTQCVERRHSQLVETCTPSCEGDDTSIACIECIKYGSMADMAFCMESGVAATATGSFILPVAAFIAVFLAL